MSELVEALKSLDPCPSCGWEDFRMNIEMSYGEIKRVFITCLTCGFTYGEHRSLKEAIKGWNKLPRNDGLKPCPICGKRDLVNLWEYTGPMISCARCKIETCILPTVEEAIKRWNELPRSYEEIAG